jgi:hypothetical protein
MTTRPTPAPPTADPAHRRRRRPAARPNWLGHRDAEVAKRCDIIATAIHQRLTVTDLLDLD